MSIEKHIHIVCHDVPYPVDYGGVFDLFYSMKALYAAGIKIHLHCYEYGRGQQPALNEFCESVAYYERQEGHKGFSTKIPYIVCSRSNGTLTECLLEDDYPILLHGIHCSHILSDDRFSKRNITLRLHNVEYEYYHQLYLHETNLLKKAYYFNESRLLKKYEAGIASRVKILAVSPTDKATYEQEFGATRIQYLPVFTPYTQVNSLEGNGSFCLYHGNLSVAENEKAAIWLLENIFASTKIPFVIAGKKPSSKLERVAHIHGHTCLVGNPGQTEMQDMIQKAQVHLLPSFNQTGVKLKLLNALYNGRFCIANDAAVAGTGLAAACLMANSPEEFKAQLLSCFDTSFDIADIKKRQEILSLEYDLHQQTTQLITSIW